MQRAFFSILIFCLGIQLISMTAYADPEPIPPGVNEGEKNYQVIAPNGMSCAGNVCSTESGVTIINIKDQQTLSAQKMTFNRESEMAEVAGRVRLEEARGTLTAESGTFDLKSKTAVVSGNVRLESEEGLVTAESGTFNLEDRTGHIQNGRLFLKQNNFHVSGDRIEKSGENTYRITNCRVTTCDREKPDWSITGSEVEITVEGYGTVKNAAFRVRNVPVFYVPWLIFPAKTKRQSGLLPPSLGRSDYTGTEIELPFFWAISDQTDLTLYERRLSKRGLMQGLEARYVAEQDSKGIVLFDWLHDQIEQKDMKDPNQLDLSPEPRTNTSRYWLRGKADQELPLNIQGRLDLDLVSDQDYLKEFESGRKLFQSRTELTEWLARPIEEINAPTRRSALRLAHDGEQYSLAAYSAYHQRPQNPYPDTTPQPLAGAVYALQPEPLWNSALFFELASQYDYIYREQGIEGHRLDLEPKLSYPLWLGRYLEFEPSLRLISRTRWFEDTDETTQRQSRSAYHFQTSLATAFEKLFDLDGPEITRLKHKVRPTLIYDFRGFDDQDASSPWFEPLDDEGRINRLTLSLAQFLDARHESLNNPVSYRQWGFFELSQPYNIREARRQEDPGLPRRPWEPLRGVLTLSPYANLDLTAEAFWNHYQRSIDQSKLSLAWSWDRAGGKKDSLNLDYLNYRSGDRYFNAGINLNLLAGLSVGSALKYDLQLRDTAENSYWLDYALQCWGVRLTVSKADNHESVMLMFRLSGLGDVGK